MSLTHKGADPKLGIARAVKATRERVGWSLNKAAAQSGTDTRSWSKVERGELVKPVTYQRVANAFGVEYALFTNAASDPRAVDALVDALDAFEPMATASDVLDPTELEDARLLLVLRAYVDELEARLSDRSVALDALLSNTRRRPDVAAISRRLARALNNEPTDD